jgi:hypothetical protein
VQVKKNPGAGLLAARVFFFVRHYAANLGPGLRRDDGF